MKKIFLIISLLLMVVSGFAAEIIGDYFTTINEKGLCHTYAVLLYDDNRYKIIGGKCSYPHLGIFEKETIMSYGTFELKGDNNILILTDVTNGYNIQMRYIFEERRLKLKDEIVKLPSLELQFGIKELNGIIFECLFDNLLYPPKPKPKSTTFSGIYFYDFDKYKTCYIHFYESGCYEIMVNESDTYSNSITMLSYGIFVLERDVITLTKKNSSIKIQLLRMDNNKIKVEQGYSYLNGKVFDYWMDNYNTDCEEEPEIFRFFLE